MCLSWRSDVWLRRYYHFSRRPCQQLVCTNSVGIKGFTLSVIHSTHISERLGFQHQLAVGRGVQAFKHTQGCQLFSCKNRTGRLLTLCDVTLSGFAQIFQKKIKTFSRPFHDPKSKIPHQKNLKILRAFCPKHTNFGAFAQTIRKTCAE